MKIAFPILIALASARLLLAQPEASSWSELQHYQNLLAEYGVASNVRGANEFLENLFPNANSKNEIADLIRQLQSSKYRTRELAEKQLVARGTQALAMLKHASMIGDTETRLRANRSIQLITERQPQIVRAAICVLKLDDSDALSLDARLDTLFKMVREFGEFDLGDQVVLAIKAVTNPTHHERIVAGLKDQDRNVRYACIVSLKKCVTKQELPKFTYLIQDRDAEVSLSAVRMIGSNAPDDAAHRLIELLESPEVRIRWEAAMILRTISGKYLGYRADDPLDTREESVDKWRQWLADSKPVTTEQFRNLVQKNNALPRGYLVSINGKSVREFDVTGKETWQHKVSLYDAQYHSLDQILIAERGSNRIRLIDRDGKTIRTVQNVNSPTDAELLDNGNILALHGTGVVSEHDPSGRKIREFTGLNNPFDVDRLIDGNTIVADSGNHRIVVLNPGGKVVWEKRGLAFPNNVFRLPDQRTLYTTYTTGNVVMLGPTGDTQWSRHLDGSTLYAVYCAAGQIFVGDGGNSRIWVLDMNGNDLRKIDIPVRFSDVNFITK